MDRHDLNPIALLFGATFTVFGLAYAIARWTWWDLDRGWVLGAILITLGTIGIFSVTRAHSRREREAANR